MRLRDSTPSRRSIISKINNSQLGVYPLTDRGHVDKFINMGKGNVNNKLSSALEFMNSYDKQKTGLIPIANFLKVMRIFGVQIP